MDGCTCSIMCVGVWCWFECVRRCCSLSLSCLVARLRVVSVRDLLVFLPGFTICKSALKLFSGCMWVVFFLLRNEVLDWLGVSS
jgi:hypothetical protein